MRYTVHIFLLISLPSLLSAQADSIIAENIYNYVLKDGRATRNRMLTKQNTFDLNNKLVRQVYYDSVKNINRSILIFYDDDLLISEETYGPDFTIDSVRRFEYNPNRTKDKEKLYAISKDGTIEKISWIQYVYNDDQLIGKTSYSGKNKWVIKTTYQKDGNLNIVNSIYKKGTDPKGVKEQIIEDLYDGEKLSHSKITTNYYDKSISTIQIRFEYDTINDQLVSKKWLTEDDSLLTEVLYQYYPDGNIRSKSIRLSSGDYIGYLVHERRDHTIVMGKPEMYAIPDND
jgi:hypothetical protein